MKDIALELTKTLGSYNKSANRTVNGINKSLMAVGYIIVSVMFLIEMMSWYRFIRNQGGEMTWKLFAEVAFKYFIAYFLVAESGAILNAILWFSNGVTKLVGTDITGKGLTGLFQYTKLKGGNFIIRGAIDILAFLIGAAAILSLKVLILLRFIELYLLKAIAPLIVAFWMSDQTRSIATNLLKRFGAIALQGVIIVVILLIWQGFKVGEILVFSRDSWLGQFATGLSYLGKCIVFLILLFGSQRTAKSLLQTT